jgi:hypothetical protein
MPEGRALAGCTPGAASIKLRAWKKTSLFGETEFLGRTVRLI